MADIRLPLGGLKFSVRVAILCVVDGLLLVHTLEGEDFAFLPGGALGTGEDAVECARREWAEETGTVPGDLRVVAVVENFFGAPDHPQHEIGFYLRMTDPPLLPAGDFAVVDDAAGRFRWLPVGEVAAYPVLPTVVGELLDLPEGEVRHTVRRSSPA